MSTRYWTRPESNSLGISEHYLEYIFDFIEKHDWLYADLKTYRDNQTETNDWLQCFLAYLCAFVVDCPELRRFLSSGRIRPNLTNLTHETQAVAIFIWENLHWLKYAISYFMKILDSTLDVPAILM